MGAAPLQVDCGCIDARARWRHPSGRARPAAAFVASLLVHAGLLGQAGVEWAAPVAPRPAGILTVRLAPPATEASPVPEARQSPASIPGVHAGPAPGATVRGGHDETSAAMPAKVPMAAATAYYSARELDVYPMPLAPIAFGYPPRAAAEGVGGSVSVMLRIEITGELGEVAVAAANPGGYFEEAVLSAFSGVRFAPARKDGRAVASRVLVRVTYDPGAGAGAMR